MTRVDDAGLARVIETTCVERFLAERVVPGTEVHHDPDVTWIVQPLGSAWRNAGIGVRLAPAGAPARLDAMLARYRAHGLGTGLWISPEATPADLPALLRARRLRCRRAFPAMVCRLGTTRKTCPVPAGVTIEPVVDAATFDAIPHPLIGPPTTPMRRFALARLRALVAAPGPPTRTFVAWLDGTPVGSVELFVGREAAGLHDLGVVERAQGRGIGSALVDRVCTEARAAGRDLVALLATTEGQHVYARRGFAEVARFRYFYRAGSRRRTSVQR